MTFDNTQPTASDALSLTELELYHLIMDYRAAQGLAAIPLSVNLTTTGGRHAADMLYNIWEADKELEPGSNIHSWSDAPYLNDQSNPEVMWHAPQRIGTDYPADGFELAAAGQVDIAAALSEWQASTPHNNALLQQGEFSAIDWATIGIGVGNDPDVGGDNGGRIYYVWFGQQADPDGAPKIKGTGRNETIQGTAFDDVMQGKGGRDRMSGEEGRDKMAGNGGKDRMSGGDGNDKMAGGGGSDRMAGDDGVDVMNGGSGRDVLTGGDKRDVFIFAGKNWGKDRVTDYDGDKVKIKGPNEAADQTELLEALSERNGHTIYDHDDDGRNVVIFANTGLADLDLTLFDLG